MSEFSPNNTNSEELKGLKVVLDRLVYHQDSSLPAKAPHAFIYFLTIQNLSDRTVTLLGRKWIIITNDGNTEIVEGDQIVGKTPTLAPGEAFSYNSYHATSVSSTASGSFHGVDQFNQPIWVAIPPFEMNIPFGSKNYEL